MHFILLGSLDFESSVSYNYKDALTATFADVGYQYTKSTNDYLFSNAVDSVGQMTLQVTDRESRRSTHRIFAGYSRLFPAIKTTIQVNANVSFGKSDFLLNDILDNQHTQNWAGDIELINSSWDFLSFTYKLDYSHFTTNLFRTALNNVIHRNQHLEMNAYYRDDHLFTIYNAWHHNNIEGMTDQYFLDIEYQWTIERFNTDIKFTVINLFDNKRFTRQYVDDYQMSVPAHPDVRNRTRRQEKPRIRARYTTFHSMATLLQPIAKPQDHAEKLLQNRLAESVEEQVLQFH